MRIDIRGAKVKITEAIKNQIEEKLGHLDQYFTNPEEIKAYVVVRVRNNEQIIEVTIPTPKFTLRSETSDEDLYAAIDLTIDKLERKIRKNKTKMRKRFKDIMQFEMAADKSVPEDKSKIMKRKEIELRPMDEEEAMLQMELIDHDFYVFKNRETDTVYVLNKRK